MIQTMKHLVEECPAHYFPEGMKSLHVLDRDVVRWLSELEKKVWICISYYLYISTVIAIYNSYII